MPDGDNTTPATAANEEGDQENNPGTLTAGPGTLGAANIMPPPLGNNLNAQQLVERKEQSWANLSGTMRDLSTSSLAVNSPECRVSGLSAFSHTE